MVQAIEEICLAELRPPALVLDVDVESPSSGEILDVSRYSTAWCLVRRTGIPIAIRYLDITWHG